MSKIHVKDFEVPSQNIQVGIKYAKTIPIVTEIIATLIPIFSALSFVIYDAFLAYTQRVYMFMLYQYILSFWQDMLMFCDVISRILFVKI